MLTQIILSGKTLVLSANSLSFKPSVQLLRVSQFNMTQVSMPVLSCRWISSVLHILYLRGIWPNDKTKHCTTKIENKFVKSLYCIELSALTACSDGGAWC